MQPILRSLPYSDRETAVTVRGTRVPVRSHQIVLWVGIARVGEDRPGPTNPRFPAILDTGYTDNFAIGPDHLRDWAGVEWRDLPLEGSVERYHQGIPVPHRRANLWVYPNQYGWRDAIDPILPPALLELNTGIAVYGNKVQVGVARTAELVAPRLPLVGLRALTRNRIALRLNAAERALWLDRLP